MNTPFEDLELLADFLPDEGESVMVSRRDGELVCEPLHDEGFRNGIADAELYGRLVLANEQLSSLNAVPFWTCLLAGFGTCVAFFELTNVGWNGWYVGLGVAALAALTGSFWAMQRRRRYFQTRLRGMIENQIRRRHLSRCMLIGAIRQHPELSILLDELSRARDAF
ncbi:MAG TPA: hypothetical protein VL475_08485 [Planctomycetaceae bacterium]|nr:hypothetical protein [Planctomycetaceae bacterium]